MIYVPDLFSAYAKGQEEAIDKNWNDLNQYETVEQARTNNDMARINLQAGMDDYGNNRAVSNALGTQAMIGEDLLKRVYPGDAANAEINSILAGSQYNAVLNNLPQLDTYSNAVLGSNLGVRTNQANAALGYSNVDNTQLPNSLLAYTNSVVAGNQVKNQNAAAAPMLNSQVIANNSAGNLLEGSRISLGAAQTVNDMTNLPLANKVTVASLNQGISNIEDAETQQKRLDRAQIVAQVNSLRQSIAVAASAITALTLQAQTNPSIASPTNAEILRLREQIAISKQQIQRIEAQFGSIADNTVGALSLMGN